MTNFAGMMLFLVFVAVNAKPNRIASDQKDTYRCLECTASEGICSKKCDGKICVKAIEHQSNSQRRYCMNVIEPGLPQPGQCKNFQSKLGQAETICVCIGDYCNASEPAHKRMANGSIVPAFTSVLIVSLLLMLQ